MKKIVYLLILVIIDQGLKGIIYLMYMGKRVTFLNNRIGFTPYLNRSQLSIFNHEFNMGLGVFTLIIVNVFCIFLLAFIYKFIKKREYTNVFYEITFILIASGAFCSLLDKIVYEGSIDFMLFFGHIYDLKDIYLFFGIIIVIVYLVTYIKHEKVNKYKM